MGQIGDVGEGGGERRQAECGRQKEIAMAVKRKSKVRVTHRKSKWQIGWERLVKRVQVALRAGRWVLVGAVMTWIAMEIWR